MQFVFFFDKIFNYISIYCIDKLNYKFNFKKQFFFFIFGEWFLFLRILVFFWGFVYEVQRCMCFRLIIIVIMMIVKIVNNMVVVIFFVMVMVLVFLFFKLLEFLRVGKRCKLLYVLLCYILFIFGLIYIFVMFIYSVIWLLFVFFNIRW